MDITTILMTLVALLVGAALGWFAHQARTGDRAARAEARLEALAENEEHLRRSLAATTDDAARRHSGYVGEQVSGAVGPLQEVVAALGEQLRRVEGQRTREYGGLAEQVRGMQRTTEVLGEQTTRLVSALRSPQVRGRWGEVQLERVVEIAGMARHCDFDTQVHVKTATSSVRPDMVVRLSGERTIVVDAKVPFSAYLDALDCEDPDERSAHMRLVAKHVRDHVEQLAAKRYWDAFLRSPEFVVLFVPGDPFLDAALSADPDLLEFAFARNVLLATPTTLVAMLRTVSFMWRQESLSRDVEEILRLGRELHGRLGTVAEHMDRLGRGLGRGVEAYNAAISSMESRVLVTARRLEEMDVPDAAIESPTPIDLVPRRITSI